MDRPDMPRFSGPELCQLTACEAVELLRRREVSPHDLIDAAMARIRAVEPQINAIPTLCEDRARKAAARIGEEAAQTGWLGGLPLGIKDLTPVAGVRTTFGTRGMADHVPDRSDPLVLRLETRGGVVLGKTNTPELGAGGNTYNDVFGATLNPWNTALNAGGSSGGAAAALATGELWLAHGSDHGGSLRTPAAYCGIVGLRPSTGRAAAADPAAFLPEGQQGPMARTVEDCALFLDAMSGFDRMVPGSYPAPATPFREAVRRAPERIRIGYAGSLSGLSPVEPDMKRYIERALTSVAKTGGTVEDIDLDVCGLQRTYQVLRGLTWVTVLRGLPETTLAHLKDTIRENADFGRALSAEDLAQAHIDRTRLFHSTATALESFDVIALPVTGNMPRLQSEEWVREVNGVRMTGYMDWLRFSFLATVTGLPAISVPIGLSDEGLPVGLQLVGPHRGEATLLAAARAVERAVGGPLRPIDPVLAEPNA